MNDFSLARASRATSTYSTFCRADEHVVKAFGRYNGELIGNGEVGLDVPIKNVEIVFKPLKSIENMR